MDLDRPAHVCRELLSAIEASEGRRKRRKRDTTPDAIGLAVKRDLLERAITADPEPMEFEAWLLEQCQAAGGLEGGVRAMALSIFESGACRMTRSHFATGWQQGHLRMTRALIVSGLVVALAGCRAAPGTLGPGERGGRAAA